MLLRRCLVCREGAVLQSLMEFTSPVSPIYQELRWRSHLGTGRKWTCTALAGLIRLFTSRNHVLFKQTSFLGLGGFLRTVPWMNSPRFVVYG